MSTEGSTTKRHRRDSTPDDTQEPAAKRPQVNVAAPEMHVKTNHMQVQDTSSVNVVGDSGTDVSAMASLKDMLAEKDLQLVAKDRQIAEMSDQIKQAAKEKTKLQLEVDKLVAKADNLKELVEEQTGAHNDIARKYAKFQAQHRHCAGASTPANDAAGDAAAPETSNQSQVQSYRQLMEMDVNAVPDRSVLYGMRTDIRDALTRLNQMKRDKSADLPDGFKQMKKVLARKINQVEELIKA